MQRENKWQDRFDERFNLEQIGYETCDGRQKFFSEDYIYDAIKAFIQSEIDMERERIVDMIIQLFPIKGERSLEIDRRWTDTTVREHIIKMLKNQQ